MTSKLIPVSDATIATIEARLSGSAVAGWFGTKVTANGDEHLYTLTFDEPHIGNPVIRALHGGVISAFLEHCATLEVLARTPSDIAVRPISVHTSYLRGSRDTDFTVSVAIQRIGRRIAFVEARGWQGNRDEEVASAQIALRLFEDE
ncbi:MAG: PaaI family thioesterase [Pseudomonadota bacterium]